MHFSISNILQNPYKKWVREVCWLIFVEESATWIYLTVMTAFQISLENSGKLDYCFQFFTLSYGTIYMCSSTFARVSLPTLAGMFSLTHRCHAAIWLPFAVRMRANSQCASSQCSSQETSPILAHSLVSCRWVRASSSRSKKHEVDLNTIQA